MSFNWSTIILTQLLVWSIILFERKQLKHIAKRDKITFATVLSLATLFSFFNLFHIPGPLTVLRALFGPLSRLL